ncbi:PadR family transcriptional regulator [Mycolicibacterium brumae]|uniref:PadR family transcriptional regulator n=1 Tax=Mycolicibacterium brumae TaxID=85968 RepID=A0A2G5PE24_9MYCO|nr:PadR family transcriptional regulator [Mycolicibacterium brumae]MCV7192690.1 PadR family transcriptional regulator [Mycolicibacterium brumae]PIB76569.1 PadR family transcriptional regulator [Mycolicibacterium brumae]RWA23275.1 hypothetical protein MBRU_00215 [Mycolicibacterium brumae DSM 44177]UWW08796.1 PadR family transcriptional regulator [Mycolicibacterium brumae]
MALRDAILAALLDGEASGYDLAKDFDSSVANFWMATPQQLYRELERMASDGLIAARLVEQDRRPNKHLFSLTDAGREQLRRFTAATPKPGAIREDLLVAVQAIDVGDAAAVREALIARIGLAEAKLAHYERRQAELLDGRNEEQFLAGAARVGPYLNLIRGLSFERENLAWCRRVIAVIDRERAAEPTPRPAGPDRASRRR